MCWDSAISNDNSNKEPALTDDTCERGPAERAVASPFDLFSAGAEAVAECKVGDGFTDDRADYSNGM
jgi:hypothetical protein